MKRIFLALLSLIARRVRGYPRRVAKAFVSWGLGWRNDFLYEYHVTHGPELTTHNLGNVK